MATLEELLPELSWLCTLMFVAILIIMIATCVCLKDHEKPYVYGTAGRLSLARDSPALQHQPRNGSGVVGLKQTSIHSTEDINLKRNSWTVKDRALPEIPDSTPSPIITTSSSVLNSKATTSDGVSLKESNSIKIKSHNKAIAPKPPGSDVKVIPLNENASTSQGESSRVTVTITVNDNTQFVESKSPQVKFGAKPSTSVAENVSSMPSSMTTVKKIDNTNTLESQMSNSDAYLYDTVPENAVESEATAASLSSSPVCIRIGAPGCLEVRNSSSPSASLAVSGAVPSSDIPYMTPPLLHNPSSPTRDSTQDNGATAKRSEVPYTVISVREPLARVREITMKKQRAAVHQSSEDSDDHYALVPEEEQMYAEIGSGHDSGSSSITYAHIEPRELPPVPPTVESLKSVAHAHSRQASTVSNSSFGSCVSSGEPTTPPTLRNPSSLYSSVEKSSKQRKTIHVAEGASLASTLEKRKKVEDLYAKVRKKRAELTINTSHTDDYQGIPGESQEYLTPPPSPWISTTPPAPPPITGRLQAASLNVLLPGCSQHIRRHSADPNFAENIGDNRAHDRSSRVLYAVPNKESDEPGYERVYDEQDNSEDSCYEKIKEDKNESGNNGEPGYESVCQVASGNNEDSNFPGYASVDSTAGNYNSLDPGYECVAQLENDPGYEPVRMSANLEDSDTNSNYSTVKLDDECEPGYEVVQKYSQSVSESADPGYEKIRKVPRVDSDATDPGYEKVRNESSYAMDSRYESVDRSDSDTEPGYEIVHHKTKNLSRYASGHSKGTSPNTTSTVLFVSGKSDTSTSRSKSVSSSHDDEPTATFL